MKQKTVIFKILKNSRITPSSKRLLKDSNIRFKKQPVRNTLKTIENNFKTSEGTLLKITRIKEPLPCLILNPIKTRAKIKDRPMNKS